MGLGCGSNQLRQILLEVPSLAEEHRDDRYSSGLLGGQRCESFFKRRAHRLEISGLYREAGKLLPEARCNAFERPRPIRVARTMGKKYQRLLQ